MRRLLRKGLPLSCCVAYILAGPIINPIVIMSTYYAFSELRPGGYGKFLDGAAALRHGLRGGRRHGFGGARSRSRSTGFLCWRRWRCRRRRWPRPEKREQAATLAMASTAIATAPMSSLSVLPANPEPDEEEVVAKRRTLVDRLGNISETALHDFIDIMVFLVLGAAIASLLRLIVPSISGLRQPVRGHRFHDADGGDDVPVQRGRRICGGQLRRAARRRQARLPGARADARFQTLSDVHPRVPARA